MKAAVIQKIKTPWQIEERPIPEPKKGQVLIKVHASGLCGTDLHIHNGVMDLPLPAIIGHSPVGEIVKTGDGVIDLKIGDRVGVSWVQKGCGRCFVCQSEKPRYCSDVITWKETGGGVAEYVVAYSAGCTLLPDSLSYEHASAIFCAGSTIASGYWNGSPKPGETVGVCGIGGLGHLAIQYAKAKGHRVIAITHQEDKREIAITLGADDVSLLHDGIADEIKSLGGIDLLLDTSTSSSTINSLLDCMNEEGRVVIMGISDEPIQAYPLQIIPKQLSIIGSRPSRRSDLVDILNLAAEGKVKPMIEVYPLSEIAHVVDRLQQGAIRFRAVITFS